MTGYAKLTATTQRFLDTCPAVSTWTEITPDLASFEFDPTVEVAIVPAGVEFSSDGELAQRATEIAALATRLRDAAGGLAFEQAGYLHHAGEYVTDEGVGYAITAHLGEMPAHNTERFEDETACAAAMLALAPAAEWTESEDEQPSAQKCCVKCAAILCDCGHYHGTDGTVAVESDRGPLYVFQQTREQVEQGDEPCDRRSQYALVDDEVERLAETCDDCERDDAHDSAVAAGA